ncbi:RagB/SusD family nutrient uptake outer membrane protein [Echinicola jeungdonensis]|uniref:RagB/SusD family nutrient uptake outer membrane protein n=1 Tax=Echinicola jeungdonensis TaxID=709343 RepID=A0ABV5J8U1_9BACT|nr:RagB/SusD family nutrient uptake outer membrane protein [Echinicola jeungdonensis]MDN3670243.1 RagB/SusD family nutrient uptake outer membrane protein [Echinicola jeungdonensis]
MKNIIYKIYALAMILALTFTTSCNDLLDEPLENELIAQETDYSQSEDMVLMLYGAYGQFYNLQWETFPIISVRGDDVNAAGDQFPLIETDEFRYDRNFWMYNSTWLNLYSDILYWHGAMEEIQKYEEAGANSTNSQQYIAEIKVLRGFELLQLARLWGSILIPESSEPSHLFNVELSTFEEVMQHISDQMDEAIPTLPSVHPNQRSDIRGGVTRSTALAVKAMAQLELQNYQQVADATGQIISSGLFTLQPDYYQLFKIPGKLSDENLLELQYSDYGTSTGTVNRYLWNFFGPSSWTPAVAGASSGWGFWEPSVKYIKFMLDRGERERLQTTVLFTPDGISEIQSDPNYSDLPNWISNESPDGDIFNNHPRYNFLSGKHYLPSVQLTEGRFNYGENKNFTCIRYSEVLLMHAEALVNGATSSAMSADDAVNAVRSRVGLGNITGVTLDQVLDEKFAEFGMEWGIRFYDLVRYGRTSELNYGGREYEPTEDRFLPYPLGQQGILPQLKEAADQG